MLLLFGGYLADRLSRRLILLLDVGGLDLLFILLAFVSIYAMLLLTLLYGGMCASCYDLVVNSIGGDYERPYASDAMTLFHAGFSGDVALMAVGGAVTLTQWISERLCGDRGTVPASGWCSTAASSSLFCTNKKSRQIRGNE